MNKTYYKLFIALLSLVSITNVFPQGKIFFDVKTKFVEKAKLTHIKNATVYLLLKSDWANVTEVGEEYAIWLKNYSKTRENNLYSTTLDIEIRQPKAIGEGKLVKSKSIEVIFSTLRDDERVNTHYEWLKKNYKNLSKELLTETTLVSDRIVDELYDMTYSLRR